MPDMLVKLYELPPLHPVIDNLSLNGVFIRRVLTPEKNMVVDWVGTNFGVNWASECDCAIDRQPVACFIAIKDEQIIGFACYDSICRDFFGPTGVLVEYRGIGVGKGILLACLHAMAEQGYAYAIIGGVGPEDFYSKVVGAVTIEGSEPGIYKGLLTT